MSLSRHEICARRLCFVDLEFLDSNSWDLIAGWQICVSFLLVIMFLPVHPGYHSRLCFESKGLACT